MKFFCIVIESNRISEFGYNVLKKSTRHSIDRFKAIVPAEVESYLKDSGLRWNYPWGGSEYDKKLNLIKTAYDTKESGKRIACAISHYRLWQLCAESTETFVILEHDAIFTNDIDFDLPSEYDLLGINDPTLATRKYKAFDSIVKSSTGRFVPVPIIDDMRIPQGIAGNSAYMLNSNAAKGLINLVDQHGLWPNDAIMCQQLLPKMGVTRMYYTSTQRLPSTTS